MYPRTVADIGGQISVNTITHLAVRIRRILADHGNDIHPKAVNSLLTPPVHHIEDFFSDFWIFPVQIRLLLRKTVEVILSAFFVLLPGTAAKPGSPVIWLLPVLSILPDIIIAIRTLLCLPALHKPRMLIRSMIHHQIHYDLEMMGMCFCQQMIKVLHGSEFRHNIAIIGDVISVVVIGRPINGGKPQHIHPQLFQIGQSLCNPVQIADSVPIRILKRAGINLVNHRLFPPRLFFFRHKFPFRPDHRRTDRDPVRFAVRQSRICLPFLLSEALCTVFWHIFGGWSKGFGEW